MKGELLLPQRLRKLREEKGLSQRALSKSLSLFMGRNKQISPSAMCAWETGDKNPSYETLLAFSAYYGVSVDYLLGKTSNRMGTIDIKSLDIEDYIIKISEEQLKSDYDNKPVYLVFNTPALLNRWGIYDAEKDRFCCKENIIINNPSIKYYAVTPESLPNFRDLKKSLTLDEAKKCTQVWIDYHHPDEEMRGRFSGWYHIDTKLSVFMASNGFSLPFDGIDVTYHVYKKKPYIY